MWEPNRRSMSPEKGKPFDGAMKSLERLVLSFNVNSSLPKKKRQKVHQFGYRTNPAAPTFASTRSLASRRAHLTTVRSVAAMIRA